MTTTPEIRTLVAYLEHEPTGAAYQLLAIDNMWHTEGTLLCTVADVDNGKRVFERFESKGFWEIVSGDEGPSALELSVDEQVTAWPVLAELVEQLKGKWSDVVEVQP